MLDLKKQRFYQMILLYIMDFLLFPILITISRLFACQYTPDQQFYLVVDPSNNSSKFRRRMWLCKPYSIFYNSNCAGSAIIGDNSILLDEVNF